MFDLDAEFFIQGIGFFRRFHSYDFGLKDFALMIPKRKQRIFRSEGGNVVKLRNPKI